MISLPLDPTLTVDNVSHIMEKVEPKERLQIVLPGMWSSISGSTNLEKEAAAVDFFVNCYPWASWDKFANSLYRRHQMAAIEEVRSYLPPRGK